jgi:hypothetical protein
MEPRSLLQEPVTSDGSQETSDVAMHQIKRAARHIACSLNDYPQNLYGYCEIRVTSDESQLVTY